MAVLSSRVRSLPAVTVGVLVVLTLAACGHSGLSVQQRADTIQVCASAAGQLRSAEALGVQLADRNISLGQAQHDLAPIAARLSALGAAHSGLPVGAGLQALALAVSNTSTLAPSDASADIRSGQGIRTAAQNVLVQCAAAAH